MTTYYAFLWVVGLLNVLRCFAFVAEVEASSPLLLNLLWLLTRFGEKTAVSSQFQCCLPLTIHQNLGRLGDDLLKLHGL